MLSAPGAVVPEQNIGGASGLSPFNTRIFRTWSEEWKSILENGKGKYSVGHALVRKEDLIEQALEEEVNHSS